MKTYILRFALLLAPALLLSACLGDEDPKDNFTDTSEVYSSTMAAITDMENPDKGVKYVTSAKFNLRLRNYSDYTTDLYLNIVSLPIGEGVGYENFDFDAIRIKVDNTLHAFTAHVDRLQPTNTQMVVINDFDIKILRRFISQSLGSSAYSPIYQIAFTVNERYRVVVFPQQLTLFGNTHVTTIDTGEVYDNQGAVYNYTFDAETQTASLLINRARFSAAMPQEFDMLFPGIPFTLVDGALQLDAAELTPSIGDTPFPMIPVTNLHSTIDPVVEYALTFDCTVGVIPAPAPNAFSVDVDLSSLGNATTSTDE